MTNDTTAAAKGHLHQCLRWARAEVLPKLDGLDEYDARRPMTATGTNLLGLVKHLAFYEATYFGLVFGRPYPDPIPPVDETFQNRDLMWVPADETRDQVIDNYRSACHHADRTIESRAVDALGHVPWWGPDPVPVFNVLAHMLGETRQHLGHMDLIREQIDGRIGDEVEVPSAGEQIAFAQQWHRIEEAARIAGRSRRQD